MASDLHMHTTFSDGKLTPEDLVEAAKAAGLKYMAITDHDTVDGVSYLYENGRYPAKGIHVIPGIEFSAHHPVHEIHILGYNVDIYYPDLIDKLNDVTEARWTRFSEMVEKLQQLGYSLTEGEVLTLAGVSKSISRSHIARILVKKGYFTSVREAFSAVLEKGKPAYVPHYHLEVEEIIELIKAAGGISVLAHPKLVGDDELVRDICQRGIEGIEVFYPRHDSEDTARYYALAQEYGLLPSGGSDFHGYPTRYPTEVGEFTIEDKWAEAFYRPQGKFNR
ncbi:MAG: PHP domain-containing protein [Selenomonas sp.]|uniref:phosphatase n=1 Tax=Selenomonas sp. TaxID=2053611 RepID=UPI0025CE331E|nr:PHP domain-containing protein [Selenomonas sp.]MCR5756295.1 PHP domain-containing protein [Selenomonas sp.]